MTHGPMGAIALAALLMAATFPALAADADPVVATVNGKDIHRSALVNAQKAIAQHGQVPLEKVYDKLLDQVIVGQLILEQANKQKLENAPEFKAQLAELRLQLLQQVYLTKRADADIPESAIKQRFEEMKAMTPPKEEVRVRHILVASEDAAKAVIADLKSGVSFEDEAKAKSLDPSGKASGGDVGYITRDKTVPQFSAAAFKLKPGEYTETPVQSAVGWHVIKVEDRRMAPPPSYEESRASIKMELAQQDMEKIVNDLKKGAQIKRFNLDGSATN
jgi:peptidyl-prolyl cis-trans isomerase C